MYKCPLCEKEFLKTKALHGHMLKSHLTEYRTNGCKLSSYGIFHAKHHFEISGAPDGFRPLDLSNQLEKAAYERGYRFLYNGDCYTIDEVKSRGWI